MGRVERGDVIAKRQVATAPHPGDLDERVGSYREQAVRQAEIRRLALALREARRTQDHTNRTQLQAIIDDLAPGLTDRPGIGPVSAAQAIIS